MGDIKKHGCRKEENWKQPKSPPKESKDKKVNHKRVIQGKHTEKENP